VVLSTLARQAARESPVAGGAVAASSTPLAQEVSVTVPAGSLEVLQPPATLTLERLGGSDHFVGRVDDLVVVDRRANPRRWELRLGVDAAALQAVDVAIERIVVTARTKSGVHATSTRRLARDRTASLLRVERVVGNGAFAITLRVDARTSMLGTGRITVIPRFVVD
jgi:hypothetical protein